MTKIINYLVAPCFSFFRNRYIFHLCPGVIDISSEIMSNSSCLLISHKFIYEVLRYWAHNWVVEIVIVMDGIK